jgi:hypothetical protein
VCNDVDFVRCAASLMPRRSKRDRLTSFEEYHQLKYGLALRHPQLPLLTVGVHLCPCNCRVDLRNASAHDHFGAARDEARAHMPAGQLRHHTFLVPEHAVLLGLTAEMSPSYVSVPPPLARARTRTRTRARARARARTRTPARTRTRRARTRTRTRTRARTLTLTLSLTPTR